MKSTRIHWSAAEIAIVRNKVLEIVSNRKMPRSSWSDVFEVAQRDLPVNRRRDHMSLNPNVWQSSKTGALCSNTTQLIAVSVLRERGFGIRDNVRVSQYAHYLSAVLHPSPTLSKFLLEKLDSEKKAEVVVDVVNAVEPVAPKISDSQQIGQILAEARQKTLSQILLHEKETITMVSRNNTEQRLLDADARITELTKTVQYLGQQIGLITEFITSHGYKPVINPNNP
jgi:hypothetical protein